MSMIPVILFAFNRPQSTARVLAALREQSRPVPHLFAFVDGARDEQETLLVEAVVAQLRAVDWTGITIEQQPQNIGLAASVAGGVTAILKTYQRVVVLEDDVVPVSHYYEAMCHLLTYYADAQNVFSVSGFSHLTDDALPDYAYDVVLSPRFSSWGWATWSARWARIADQILDFENPFASTDAIPTTGGADLRQAIDQMQAQPGTSWAYPVSLLSLYHGWLHAHTRRPMIENIGLTDGTHRVSEDAWMLTFFREHVSVLDRLPQRLPIAMFQPRVAVAVCHYFDLLYQGSPGSSVHMTYPDRFKRMLLQRRYSGAVILFDWLRKILKRLRQKLRKILPARKKMPSPASDLPQWVRIPAGILQGYRLFLIPNSPVDWQRDMVDGCFDAHIYRILNEQPVLRNKVVWDVGAHIGYHTLGMATLVGADGQVIAFEPNPYNRRRLDAHLKQNPELSDRIRVQGCALSDTDGFTMFHFSPDIDAGLSSGGYIDEAIVPLDADSYDTFITEETQLCKIDSLCADGVLPPPDILKIDVEGAEHLVLQGGQMVLETYAPLILMEVHNVTTMFHVQAILLGAGYQTSILPDADITTSRCFICAEKLDKKG